MRTGDYAGSAGSLLDAGPSAGSTESAMVPVSSRRCTTFLQVIFRVKLKNLYLSAWSLRPLRESVVRSLR